MQAELDQYEQAGDRVNEQVVQMFSQAQLVVEEMVQDVSRDARERIGQAREHERQIVAEAMDTAGQQVRSYARTAQAQMQSIVDSFANEVDQLGSAPLAGDRRRPRQSTNDGSVDGTRDWQNRVTQRERDRTLRASRPDAWRLSGTGPGRDEPVSRCPAATPVARPELEAAGRGRGVPRALPRRESQGRVQRRRGSPR